MAKSAKFYQTQAFKKLNDKWAKELKRSGFADIEQPADFKSGNPDGNLKQWAASPYTRTSFSLSRYQSTEEYYRLAGQFLYEHKFSNDDERSLWEMHSEGLSIDSIIAIFKAKKIERLLGRKLNRRHTNEVIRRLASLMTEKLKK